MSKETPIDWRRVFEKEYFKGKRDHNEGAVCAMKKAFQLGRVKERAHLLKLIYVLEEQGGTCNLVRALEGEIPFKVWSPIRAKVQPHWVELLKRKKEAEKWPS